MRKTLTIGASALIGASLMYLLDPERGRSRRARMSDQAAARGRDLLEALRKTAEYQKGRALGLVHDFSASLQEEQDYDDETLAQKVKSEALGYWDDSDVEIDITDGIVKVSGKVRDPSSRDQLLRLIQKVDGVSVVDDRLRVDS